MKHKFFEDDELISRAFNEEGSNLGKEALNKVKAKLKEVAENHGGVYYTSPYELEKVIEEVGGLLKVKVDFDAKKAIAKAREKADKEIADAKKAGVPYFIGVPSEAYARQTESVKIWEKLEKAIFFSVFRDSSNKAGSRADYDFKKKDVIKEAKKKGIEFVIGEFVL